LKVKLARTAGFCMGVRRAMEMVLAEVNKGTWPLYTYGPLIHNRQVSALLETKGVKAIDDIKGLHNGTIVIRAHGIPPSERRRIKSTGLRIRDATCPRVAGVQAIISSHTKRGYHAVIVGDKDHPEVMGLMGYANGKAHAIKSAEEVAQLPRMKKLFVVAQTTQSGANFQEVVKAIQKRFPDALIFDTICDATYSRQEEVRAFADQVDGVVVVGGYNSGNTQRLVQISREAGMPTFHVETENRGHTEPLRDRSGSLDHQGCPIPAAEQCGRGSRGLCPCLCRRDPLRQKGRHHLSFAGIFLRLRHACPQSVSR
jgi:(E)-4-hydroxy-3-methyl-but-2-enyl pyrophosphate reductase